MADILPTTAMKVKKVTTESPGHNSGQPNEAQRQPSAPHAICRMVLVKEPIHHPNPTSHYSDDGGSSDPLGALPRTNEMSISAHDLSLKRVHLRDKSEPAEAYQRQWLPDDFIAEVEALRKQKDKESSSAKAEGSEKADKPSTKFSISLKKPEVEVVDWVEGVDAPLKFPDELKFAAQFYDMPLEMFTNASLTKIWNLQKTFTLKKCAHPQYGQQMVWDIADIYTLTLSLLKDNDLEGLDYVGWVEAVVNYLKFVEEVNIDGKDSNKYHFMEHFCFFIDKHKARELFTLWKKEERLFGWFQLGMICWSLEQSRNSSHG
uniref:Uncharacterized protein n=1 Tax=Moniliophthora roreri TaxID=221103 RepID=A0A0W0GE83_MONRR